LAYIPDYKGDALFEAKVCSSELYVTINDFVRDVLLLQPGELKCESLPSRFDLWWHGHILALTEGFNTV
jgi:hypothetical protein